MWLFVAKPLLNAKNVINGHSLYVIYDILCPRNQRFWLKVPFITFMWLLGTKSHIAPKEIRWPICFTKTNPFSPNQYYTRVLHANPNIDDNGICHRKKRPMNLVLISHKYSQRNTNLEITFCHRCENLFSLQSEGWEIKSCVKNYGFSQKLR